MGPISLPTGRRSVMRKILLVEDNPDDEALTIRALRKNNILNEVIVARDGAEALGLLFPQNGSQLEEDILASYRGGANGYVRKPVNFSEFTKAVSTVGMFWLLLNEPVPDLTPTSD